MNEPIISPWLIYWITRIDPLKSLISYIAMAITVSIIPIILFLAATDAKVECTIKYIKRWTIATFIAILFTGTICVFIPSKEVIIAMYAAKQVTPANIQTAGELADKSIDYIGSKADKASDAAVEKIIRIIDAIKKEEKKK